MMDPGIVSPATARPHKVDPGEEYAVLFQGGPLELYNNSSSCKAKPLVRVDKESVLDIPLRFFSEKPLEGGYGLWSPHLELVDHFFGGIISNIIDDLPAGHTYFDFDREAYRQASRRSIFIPMGTAHHSFPQAVEELEEVTIREFNRAEAVRFMKQRLGKELRISKEEDLAHFNNGQPWFMYSLKGKYRGREVEYCSHTLTRQPAVEVRFKELVSGVGSDLLYRMVQRLKQQYSELYYDQNTDDDSGKITFSVVYVKNRISKKSVYNLPRVLEKIEKEIAATKVKIRQAEREMEKY